MRKLIKNILWVGALMFTLSSAWAFSLLGPGIGGGTAGDSWEQPIIGYGLAGDVGTPKNIGEEYRRVTPVMYYASDATFLGFFGLAGTTNIDAAFAIMNGALCGQTNNPLFLNSPTNGILSDVNGPYTGTAITLNATNNLDGYPADLADFPLESQQVNYTARELGLLDLKSFTLGLLVEQLGLAEPERYTWTLHDRFLNPIPGARCPGDEEYVVVMRNFDIIDSPLNQVQYSPYVNGTLYSFVILEACTGPNPLAITFPFGVDIFADTFTSVASLALFDGGFYTSLTRDDVAGLRYLLSSNNINFEATAPSGGLLLITNVQSPVQLTTQPISLLFSSSLTNDPNTLQTNFPGLTFLSVTTNTFSLVTSNVTAYFTNLPPPYTNHIAFSNGMAIFPTNGIVPFTNYSPVQYGPAFPVTTQPLGPLLALLPFTDPATLQALYPGLIVGTIFTNFLVVQVVTNITPFFTNQSVAPVFSNSVVGGLTNGFYFTNQPGPTVINYDLTSYLTITTLDLAVFSDLARTNDPATLQALYPGLQILQVIANPTTLYVTNYVTYLTNYTGAPYQGLPVAKTVAVSTNSYFGTVYSYIFGNVFTNHYSTNRIYRSQNIWITNLIGAPYPSPLVAVTNYTYVTNKMISGDFFIIPTNWCGFQVLSVTKPNINPPYTFGPTNAVVYQGYSTNGPSGTNNVAGGNSFGLIQFVADIYTNYLIAVRPGICEPVLAFATNITATITNTFQYSLLNILTNHYYTNTLVTVMTTNIQACPGGSPNQLCTNIQNSLPFYTNLPSGDFFIIPTNWCGFQIISLLTNLTSTTNVVIGANTVIATNGSQFTSVTVTTSTNYTYSIRAGVCEPSLQFFTNYSTNIVTQYTYVFANIVTNHFFTNGPIITVTTNIAFVTNGLVGTLTNIITTNVLNTGVNGDFFIVPPNFCAFNILSQLSTTVILSTNTFFATNAPTTPNLGQVFSQTTVTSFTNSTFLVQPSTCDTQPAAPALRQGIQRVEFIRANYDSLLGQFFQAITNNYTMVKVTNSQPVKEFYQRVITQPDILIRARDLVAGPSTAPPFFNTALRSLTFDQSQILPGLAGPGTIVPSSTITFNKVGNFYAVGSRNLYQLSTNAFLFLGEDNLGSTFGISNRLSIISWASFDGSTNDPVVYPNGTSIANLVNQLYIQVSPATVSDGTNGVPYNGGAGVTFTITGGQPPYTFAAPNFSATVPGLSFNPTTGTITGTPTTPGTFNFVIQVTDAVNRVVTLNYSIIIH